MIAESKQCEVAPVTQAMVFHCVAALDDFPAQIRVAQRPLADAEEGGFRAVLVEQVEYSRCNLWLRAVVDGNGHLTPRRDFER